MGSRGVVSKIEDLSKDPVYNKLKNLKPEEYCREDNFIGRFCNNQANVGRNVLMKNLNFITHNFEDPDKYKKYLEAEGVGLIELILNPKYIPWFDYGKAFKESAYIKKSS